MLKNRKDPELDPLQIITDPEDQGRPKVTDPEDQRRSKKVTDPSGSDSGTLLKLLNRNHEFGSVGYSLKGTVARDF